MVSDFVGLDYFKEFELGYFEQIELNCFEEFEVYHIKQIELPEDRYFDRVSFK